MWRTVCGLGLTAAVWVATLMILLVLVADQPGLSPRLLLLGYLGSFGAMILGLGVALRLLHRRGLASVVGPGGLRWRWWFGAAAILFGLVAIGGLPVFLVMPPVRNLELATWVIWLPLAVPLVALQTAAEELVFRGYLMQQLAVRFRSPVIWCGVPAALFGMLHWNPAMFGPNAALVVLTAGVIGLILGDITARLGNLSAAMGLHFANNTLALLVVAMPTPMAALSLYVFGTDPGDTVALRILLILDLGVVLAAYGVWRLVRRRRARLQKPGSGPI